MIEARVQPTFRVLAIELIDDPPLPSRSSMDEEKLAELVASIRTLGFISVLVVVQVGERFQVVAGHRRRRAAGLAGLTAVPCFLYPTRDAAGEAIQFAENRFREDLSVTDEAIWFSELLELHPEEGTDGLAARLNETRAYVEGRLLLLRGCERVFRALAAGEIPIGVAHELNKCTEDAHRYMLLDQAVRAGSTVGMVRTWVIEWKTIHAPASVNVPPIGSVAAGGPVLTDSYFVCRACGERENTANMLPVNVHDYCLRALVDPRTGYFKSRADYLEFPATRESALALVKRILDRFPELAESA